MQWTEPAGTLLVIQESARRRLGAGSATDRPYVMRSGSSRGVRKVPEPLGRFPKRSETSAAAGEVPEALRRIPKRSETLRGARKVSEALGMFRRRWECSGAARNRPEAFGFGAIGSEPRLGAGRGAFRGPACRKREKGGAEKVTSKFSMAGHADLGVARVHS